MLFAKRSTKESLNWRLAIIITLLGWGLVVVAYISAQQVVRLGANSAPATMAAAVSSSFQSGADPSAAVGAAVPSLGGGEQPSVIIYDTHLKPIGTNITGYLGRPEALPLKPPTGTFSYNNTASPDNRFTWQPTGSLRLATVITKAGDKGYVLAASNLAEPEKVETTLTLLAFGGLAGVLLVAVIALIL